jgi:hypothetical protein
MKTINFQIKYTKISNISEVFQPTSVNIKTIKLNQGFGSIKILVLSNNPNIVLGKSESIKNLYQLSLWNCNLSNINLEFFEGLDINSLSVLSLSGNNLSEIDNKVLDCMKLIGSVVSLNGNNLTTTEMDRIINYYISKNVQSFELSLGNQKTNQKPTQSLIDAFNSLHPNNNCFTNQ